MLVTIIILLGFIGLMLIYLIILNQTLNDNMFALSEYLRDIKGTLRRYVEDKTDSSDR